MGTRYLCLEEGVSQGETDDRQSAPGLVFFEPLKAW